MIVPPADVVRQLLINLGLGGVLTAAWPVFSAFLPEDPDNAICVYDTPGVLDGRLMRTGEQIEHPGVQVRVRGLGYRETFQKAANIALALDAQMPVEITFTDPATVVTIKNISRSGAVMPLGMEEGTRRRYNFTINALLTTNPQE